MAGSGDGDVGQAGLDVSDIAGERDAVLVSVFLVSRDREAGSLKNSSDTGLDITQGRFRPTEDQGNLTAVSGQRWASSGS